MKYLGSVIYLAVGIILPLVYLNIIDKIHSREVFLLAFIFISCTGTGIWLIFAGKINNKSTISKSSDYRADKRVIPEHVNPSPIRSISERIKDRASMKRAIPVEESKSIHPVKSPEKDSYKPAEPRGITMPPEPPKPEALALMEDIKNLIKLESWLMALQKANELIHYYPDTPEAYKIRGSINSLVGKVRETKQR